MQQDLDRTRESLASAFDTLSDNARRQQHLYSVTIAVLIAIVFRPAARRPGGGQAPGLPPQPRVAVRGLDRAVAAQ
ncbi:hypothetical protein [Cupriavidus sp. DF5525]|uniref:hypothetical protein n=1 Tax=Cupriavidus sp. DF5525 TaxID=3160989 RepID=UPI0003FAE188